MKRVRYQQGSVVLDKRRKVWNFLISEHGTRRTKKIGSIRDYPTKTAAWRAAENIKHAEPARRSHTAPSVRQLIEQYRVEKMPRRKDTRRSYEVWIRNHILPKWGDCPLSDLEARPVELWLESLSLAPKSKAHIHGVIRILWDYAMWSGDVPRERNPMELVTVRGASKRKRQQRSLTVNEFRSFAENLEQPFRTIASLCVCLGLRISECLALKWSESIGSIARYAWSVASYVNKWTM
jgi:integrase